MPKDVLISGTHAAELVGVSPPTFYRMAREEKGLEPVPAAGQAVVWSLVAVLKWLSKRDEKEQGRRAALIEKWTEAPDAGATQ